MKQFTIFLLGLFTIGCSSKSENKIDFVNEFAYKEQVFIINHLKDTTIFGEQGTQIFISKDIINNKLSINDTVRIILKEYYDLSDMILAGLSTTSSGKLLETKGMINIDLRINNRKIDSIGNDFGIKFKGMEDLTDYSIFYGNMRDIVNWELDSITKNYHLYYNTVLKGMSIDEDWAWDSIRVDTVFWDRGYTIIDSIITFTQTDDTIFMPFDPAETLVPSKRDYEFIFKSSKLGWINCDRFVDFQDLTDIMVKPNIKGNPNYFLVFENLNSIVPNSDKNSFKSIPTSEKVKLIGLSKKAGKYYFGVSESFVIRNNMVIDLNFVETPIEMIKQQIKKLD